jgi:hypothetical protein
MNIKHITPKACTKKLEQTNKGEVFRFANSSTPYMRIQYDGNEIFDAYHHYYDLEDAIADSIQVFDKDLYQWNDNTLDYEYYQDDSVLTQMCGYVNLATGEVFMSHQDEEVVVVRAELTIEDVRSPD